MGSSELQDSCYKHAGVTVTPQARRMGYEFPVYVSNLVWQEACLWNGNTYFETSLDRRIHEVIQACYEGMLKKLTQHDGFLYYTFKHWIWPRHATRQVRKKKRVRYGARLFVDETGAPWLYIFDPKRDNMEALEKGELECSGDSLLEESSDIGLDGQTVDTDSHPLPSEEPTTPESTTTG